MAKSDSTKQKPRPRRRMGKASPADAKTLLLGARVSPSEMASWEERFLKPGTHRSEVIRGMLKIGRIRKRREVVSPEVRWDYARAMLMRGSIWSIRRLLAAIKELPANTRAEAYRNAVRVVRGELDRIERELNALQLRGGFTNNNPAQTLGDWQDYFEEGWGPDDC